MFSSFLPSSFSSSWSSSSVKRTCPHPHTAEDLPHQMHEVLDTQPVWPGLTSQDRPQRPLGEGCLPLQYCPTVPQQVGQVRVLGVQLYDGVHAGHRPQEGQTGLQQVCKLLDAVLSHWNEKNLKWVNHKEIFHKQIFKHSVSLCLCKSTRFVLWKSFWICLTGSTDEMLHVCPLNWWSWRKNSHLN